MRLFDLWVIMRLFDLWVIMSVLPEILEPIRRHLGVSNRVLDIFVTHIVLEGSGIVPIVSELVAS